MSDAHIDDELLNRYADGDLSASEAASVEAALSGDDATKAQYDAILRLRTMIDATGQELAQQAQPDRMFAAIEAGIAAQASVDAAAQAASAQEHAPQAQGFWTRLLSGGGWMPAAGTIAALAAVLLTIYSPVTPEELTAPPEKADIEDDGPVPDQPAVDPQLAEAAPDEPAANPSAPGARSEIVEVDFGQNAGTVFEIALENGSSTPVVWINDDE